MRVGGAPMIGTLSALAEIARARWSWTLARIRALWASATSTRLLFAGLHASATLPEVGAAIGDGAFAIAHRGASELGAVRRAALLRCECVR